jgi:hypothetical protein
MTLSIDWNLTKDLVNSIADLLTIAASGLAIYLFIAKRKEVGAILNVLAATANQGSMADLKAKLDRLNDLNATDTEHRTEVVNICHEVCGHIDGNPAFAKSFSAISERIKDAVTNKRKPISEPLKRALVSELRESMRHFNTLAIVESVKEPQQ